MNLTDTQKNEILRLRDKNVPFGEIAERLGLPRNTVKSYYQRLTQKLAEGDGCARCDCCGRLIVQVPKRKRKRFCGKACREYYHNHHRDSGVRAICQYCGAAFDNIYHRDQKYCSRACYNNARWGEVNADGEGSVQAGS